MSAPALLVNPPGLEPAYLEALQRNFRGWGEEAEFDWWFRREVGAPRADLLVLVEGGDTLVAGAAVCYRRLHIPGAREEPAGVLTGAWTARQYRRRGCFTELIERARDVAGSRGSAMLLAFSSTDPESRDALARASFAETDTWYVGGDSRGRPADPRAERPSSAQLHSWFHENRVGAGIAYPTAQVFAEQALLTDPTTRVAEAPGGLWGILAAEHVGGGVQAVVSEDLMPDPAAVATALNVWSLPAYTADPLVAAKVPAAPGVLFGMTVSGRPSPPTWPTRWSLNRMDRM